MEINFKDVNNLIDYSLPFDANKSIDNKIKKKKIFRLRYYISFQKIRLDFSILLISNTY